MKDTHILPASICSALSLTGVIGSKVTDHAGFMAALRGAIESHNFGRDRIPGQGLVQIPDAIPFVSAGVGRPTTDPSNYVLREYRGRVSAFLKRDFAAPVEGCAAVVYTMKAYLDDPDITPTEASRITAESLLLASNVSSEDVYVLVAVLAFAGPQSQLGPYRFVANLAGGNHEAQVWTADEIRAKAKAILDYDNNWTTVAD